MMYRTMLAATLGLAICAGCKKRDEPQAGGSGGGSITQEGSAPSAAPTPSAPTTPPGPAKPAARTGRDLAQHFLDCTALIDATKWDDFTAACLARGFVAHHADEPDVPRDALIPKLSAAKVAFPDLKLEPQLVLVSGRGILAVSLLRGTNDGPMKGDGGELPATKRKMGVLLYERLAWDDENRATEQWSYSDPGTMLGQLGQLPKEVPPARPALERSIVAGAPVIAVSADDEKERANIAVVKQGNAAFNAKKAADLMALFADDALESDQASPADARGKANIEKGLRAFWAAFSDIHSDIANVWAAGDYVVAEGTYSGTHDGSLGKLPKTGKKLSVQYAEIFKLKDGKIVELWRFRNGVSIARQLGLLGGPPQGAAPKGAPT